MHENESNISPSQNNEHSNSYREYLGRAKEACIEGDMLLGMHLYLAAFERAQLPDGSKPDEAALDGLKEAWALAVKLKERSIAEYVFERLEPYLTQDEIETSAQLLQNLTIDKLSESGLPQAALEGIKSIISQEGEGFQGAHFMQVNENSFDDNIFKAFLDKVPGIQNGEVVLKDKNDLNAASGASSASSTKDTEKTAAEVLTYKELTGFDKTIATMRDYGIGVQDDPEFKELIEQLNTCHGLDRMPASDVILFRSAAREDAGRFVAATLGELGLPSIRMRMEENMQGMPVLCVMVQADNQPKLNIKKTSFEGGGVLILEDLDLWTTPLLDAQNDELGGFLLASLSRGAKDAITLIRSAVENPEVYVLASASSDKEIDPFFYDLLDPSTIVDIDLPTASERADILTELFGKHPSLRGIDRVTLVRLTAEMPRFDIYIAVQEAVEQAYRESLAARRYLPVEADKLFEKLAAYQPLDSDEYRALEEAVVDDFRKELENLEDLLRGNESN